MAKTAQISKSRMAPGLHEKIEAANPSTSVPKEGTRVKVQRLVRSSISAVIFGAFALAASVPAHGGTIWTTWTYVNAGTAYQPGIGMGSAMGTLNGVPNGVVYWGQIPSSPSSQLSIGYSSAISAMYPGENGNGFWNGPTNASNASFTGSGVTAPPTSADSVPIIGDESGNGSGEEYIYFSTPVTDPLIAIWSLGSPTTPAVFIFSGETIELEAGGADAQYGGSSLDVCPLEDDYPTGCSTGLGATGTVAYGIEGSGIIMLQGTFGNDGYGNLSDPSAFIAGNNGSPAITFTTPDSETYYAITIGEEGPIPEPETLSLLGLGLLALPLLRASLARRRSA
jgi:hypothetical protein